MEIQGYIVKLLKMEEKEMAIRFIENDKRIF